MKGADVVQGHLLSRILFICLYASAAGYAQQEARVIYVEDDAKGVSDGSSWQNAYPRLQDALARAQTVVGPVEIRVARGVYKPDQGGGITPGDKTASFRLLNGVTLLGGYAGAAGFARGAQVTGDTRDVNTYETILSGDLKGDDGPNSTGSFDNSCRVVVAVGTDESAVLDGFTITAGGAPGTQCGDEGGDRVGMTVDAGSPLLRGCRFAGNNGAGLFIRHGGAPTVTECGFQSGWMGCFESEPVLAACRFDGASMSIDDHSRVSLIDCAFESAGTALTSHNGNTVTLTRCTFTNSQDWGMVVRDSNAVLTDCLFAGNGWGPKPGGGIQLSTADLSLSGCRFVGNKGTGVNSYDERSLHLIGCSFVANTDDRAGAIVASGNLTVCDCEFIDNFGQSEAGAIRISGDRLVAAGCLFVGNSCLGGFGAGAIFGSVAVLRLSNCTFADNRGLVSAVDCRPSTALSRIEVRQCIVRSGPAFFAWNLSQGSQITVAYSNVQGGYPGAGNMDIDPLFVNPGYWGDPNDSTIELGPQNPRAVWVHGDYHLQSQAGHWNRPSEDWVRDEVTSPCIDAGDPKTSVGLEPFPNGGVVNMGAYGGTVEASRSYFGEPMCEIQMAGDINGDCKVDATDQAIASLRGTTQETGATNLPPTLALVSPKDGDVFQYPTPVSFHAVAADADGFVIDVQYIMEHRGTGAGELTQVHFAHGDPENDWKYTWEWWGSTGVPFEGVCTIRARALDSDGVATVLPEIKVTLLATN